MKKIYSYFLMMFMSVNVFAQWTKPVCGCSAINADGSTEYYLYNTEYDGFLVGANDWSTRASIASDHGYKVRLKQSGVPVNHAVASKIQNPNGGGICPLTQIAKVTGSVGAETWDTQFFIVFNRPVNNGTKVHVKFDYKASQNVDGVNTQLHSTPGNYLSWGILGSLNFTTQWQSYESDIIIPEEAKNQAQSISIDLGISTAEFEFNNISVTYPDNDKYKECFTIETFVEVAGWANRQDWFYLWATDHDDAFIDYHDQGEQFYNTWMIEPTTDNNFELYLQAVSAITGWGKFGWSEYADGITGTKLWFQNNGGAEGVELSGQFMGTWALVSMSEWAKYQQDMERYEAAMQLKELIGQIKAEIPGADLTDIEKVYNNTSSTLMQLNEALVRAHTYLGTSDLSYLLRNPTFSDGFNGWTNSVGANPKGNFGGLNAFPSVEVFENVVDVQQTVVGVPNGIYAISVQAFERPAWNGNYTGNEIAKTQLFMNEFYTPVQNIMADAMPLNKAEDQVNCYLSKTTEPWFGLGLESVDYASERGYVPDGMVGASVAFRAGRYVQKTYGLVNDGVMKIGLTSNGEKVHWVLWANMNLNFLGKDLKAIQDIMSIIDTRATEFLKANEVTTPVSTEFTRSYSEVVSAALITKDGDKAFSALCEYNNAFNQLEQNAIAVRSLHAMKADLDNVASSATMTQDAKNKYQDVTNRYASYKDLTTAQITQLINDMASLVSRFSIPDYSNASESSPIDFTPVIYNAAYQYGNLNGWDYCLDSWTNDNTQYINSKYNTEEDAYVDGFAECWRTESLRQGVPNGHIQQTLSYLPIGQYSLEVCAIATLQYDQSQSAKNVNIFASEAGQETKIEVATTDPYSHNGNVKKYTLNFSKTKKDEDLVIGVKWENTNANWVAVDNWKLTYYGSNIASQLANLIQTVTNYLNQTLSQENGYIRAVVEIAIEDAKAAQSKGSVFMEEAYEALMKTYQDAQEYVANAANSVPGSATAIELLRAMGIQDVKVYNLSGKQLESPARGINIMVFKYSDGSIRSRKVLQK